MASDHGADGQWERVASELRACRDAQQKAWGDLDNATLGRFLAGDISPQERRRVEAALAERPELRQLTDLVSDVLRDCEPASPSESAARPATLPFRKMTPVVRRWRQWTAVAAAAAFLLFLGYTVLPKGGPGPAAWSGGGLAKAPDRAAELKGTIAMHPPSGEAPPAPPGGKTEKGAAAEKEADDAAPTALALACADGLNWAGERLQTAGDLDHAELTYSLAQNIQLWKLGPDAPPTVETRQRLGDVYQVALNTPDPPHWPLAKVMAVPGVPNTVGADHNPQDAPRKDVAKKEGEPSSGAYRLRERIVRQTTAEVRKSVVPVLVQNLRRAETSQEREQLGNALAELGPAARDAVPVLEACLAKAKTPEERAVVLRALGEMGPSSEANAAPVLVTALKSPSPVERRAAEEALLQYGGAARDALAQAQDAEGPPSDRAEWQSLKSRLLGAEGRVGVCDAGDLLSPLGLKEGRRAVRELALDYHVELFAETAAATMQQTEDKGPAREVGPNGVAFVIRRLPPRVDLTVGRALRDQGFDDKQQEGLRRAVEAEAGRRDYDQALLEGVRFVARFQAERAGKAPPKP